MSGLQINIDTARRSSAKWEAWGLHRAPFPESGVASDVRYDGHLTNRQLETLSDWLNHSLSTEVRQWQPLALKGSIGVGKTHWLHHVERTIADYRDSYGFGNEIVVSNHVLTGAGMRSLTLGALLEEGLAGKNLVRRVALACRGHDPRKVDLPSASPIARPIARLCQAASKEEGIRIGELLEGWLCRRRLSPTKLETLGVGHRLEAEGQWVRAHAHLCRVAREIGEFQVWFVFIDQLEDLWRRDVTSPLRRARFLTDLRTMIDEAYDGAPIAVAMAWNTGGGPQLQGRSDVEAQLNRDYHALFSRIFKRVVEIPMLPRSHAQPFAEEYIINAGGSKNAQITHRLATDLPVLLKAFRGQADFPPRDWLSHLAQWASELPSSGPPR